VEWVAEVLFKRVAHAHQRARLVDWSEEHLVLELLLAFGAAVVNWLALEHAADEEVHLRAQLTRREERLLGEAHLGAKLGEHHAHTLVRDPLEDG